MYLLQVAADISVIVLWHGHESPSTTHHCVEADLTMKKRGLVRFMRYNTSVRLAR
jgi:hypothetical protein